MTVSLNVVQESINYSAIAVPEQYAIGTGAQIAVFFLRLLGGAMCENNISQLHTFGQVECSHKAVSKRQTWCGCTIAYVPARKKPWLLHVPHQPELQMITSSSNPNTHRMIREPVNGRCDDVTSSMRCCRFTSTSGHNCLDLQVWHLCVHLS